MTADPNPVHTRELSATAPSPDRRDVFIALGIGLLAVLIYTLALALDILYSDSGEFQTLAYTWGTTHSTGYPVYLLLARFTGLIPVNTLAWRVSFFSALSAGVTVGTLYLLVRFFTARGGALLASLVLLLSYTFWSQSIIAEVYTPATALISLILLLILLWCEQPLRRRWLVFLAGLLLGIGLGVHFFLALTGPAVLIFVVWGQRFGTPEERGNWAHLARLVLGGITGLVIFFLLFAFMDARPTPTNFYATTMIPSRDAWNLSESDFDTTLERFWMSVSSVQWRDAMLPQDADYKEDLRTFFEEYLAREYTLPTLILALLGILVALLRNRRQFALVAVAVIVAFVAGLVYHPGDQYIFYLPVYLMVGLLAGVGAGFLLTFAASRLPEPLRPMATSLLTLVLMAVCVAPLLASRWQAVQTGESRFVSDTYAYPVENLDEPRRAAECAVSKVAEEDAFLVLNWRALYSIYYVAHVEQGRTGLVIREVQPHGTEVITQNLLAEIAAQIAAGVPVYVDDDEEPALRRLYMITPVRGDCRDYTLFRLAPGS